MNQRTNVRQLKNNIMKKNADSIFDEKTIKSLLKSEEDIEKGRTKNAKHVLKELEEKYGF